MEFVFSNSENKNSVFFIGEDESILGYKDVQIAQTERVSYFCRNNLLTNGHVYSYFDIEKGQNNFYVSVIGGTNSQSIKKAVYKFCSEIKKCNVGMCQGFEN